MIDILTLYNKGIKNWNRGYIEKAKSYIDKVYEKFYILDSYDKKNLYQFYISIKQEDKAVNILKYMLYNNEELLYSAYELLTIKNITLDEQDLFFIESIYFLRKDIKINYMIMEAYLKINLSLRAYERATYAIDYIESLKNRNSIEMTYYYKLIIKVIELEYNFENFVQARYQIRKLINISAEFMLDFQEEIIYWSTILGTLNEILDNHKWIDGIKNIQNIELKSLVYLWASIYKSKLTIKKYELFKNMYILDERLKERAQILNIYIKKSIKDNSWKDELKNVSPYRCYITLILNYEYMLNCNIDKNEILKFIEKYYEYHSDIYQIVNIYSLLVQKKREKVLSNISIQFIGGANKIGGSCILIKYKDKNILLDAGANVNESNYYPDFLKLDQLNLKDINHLLISHAHLDHTGSVPYIYNQNKDINIICTEDTKNIMKVILEDSAHISHNVEGIFSISDIKHAISVIKTIDFEKEYKLDDNITITLYKAGHILGAACILLNIDGTTILYTGDYCLKNQHTVSKMDLPKDLYVDILITETTYANNPTNFKLSRENQEKLLVESIKRSIDKEGVVLIPSFAVGRAQEILLSIKKYYKDSTFIPFDVYIDGKVVDICDIYQRSNKINIFEKGITNINSKYKQEKVDILKRFKGSCIIASSGMLNDGSSSSRYASQIIDDINSSIFFSGYLDEESTGKQILKSIQNDVVPTINIDSNKKEIKCNIASYNLSSHATKEEILKVIISTRPKYVFLVHGDTNKNYKYLENEEIGKKVYFSIEETIKYIKDLKIIKPKNGQVFKI